MKKTILTLSMIGMFSAGLLAQGVSGGIKVGANFANQKISGSGITLDTKMKPGFQAGVYLTAMFSEKIGLQPEVLYSLEGSKYENGSATTNINLTYVNVPVLLRYNITEMFNVHAGPQFGFITKAEFESDGDKEDAVDSFKKSDVSIAFGAGVDLPVGLNFGLRYAIGLADIAEEDGFGDGSIKSANLQVYLGYTLFGKK